MFDIRHQKLAKILINYSIRVKKGDKVLIKCSSLKGLPLAKEVYKQILLKKAFPHLELSSGDLSYFYFKNATLEQIKSKPKISLFLAQWADKFVNIVADINNRQLANVKSEKILLKAKTARPIQDIFLKKPWVLTYYPTASLAQSASLSLEEMEDFYFQACLRPWQKEAQKMKALKQILDGAKEIEVIGGKTHLFLSFKNRTFAVCAAEYNMPDGEIFSCPLETETNGEIYFDFPSLRQGKIVKGASFTFKKGKVVKFSAEENEDFLKQTLAIDKGVKTLGEFALGTNYDIQHFMYNTLFDEKIGGTIHLALGNAYPENEPGGGKNKSAIHWDFVKDMRKKGSLVLVDGKEVLKNGKILGLEK